MEENKYEQSKIDLTKIPNPVTGGIDFTDFIIQWNLLMDNKEEDANKKP